jgi:hypothetical protein
MMSLNLKMMCQVRQISPRFDDFYRLTEGDPVVRQILEMRLSGYSDESIARRLEAEGTSMTTSQVRRRLKRLAVRARQQQRATD